MNLRGYRAFERMKGIMAALRAGAGNIAGRKTLQVIDYAKGIDGLPKSDVLKYVLAGDALILYSIL